jgi:hydroxymethylglutaryl-CoA lyase
MASIPWVDIREVGPRDGLQSELPVPVSQRIELINGLIGAGVRHIEVASFMRDDLVPAMAGAEEVVRSITRVEGLTLTGLVANLAGVRRALLCNLDEITVTVSISDFYSRKNTGKSTSESISGAQLIINEVGGQANMDVVISCAFGSPYGDVDMHQDLLPRVKQLRDFGYERITLADTTGEATPRTIRGAIDLVGSDIGLHLHETRGTGIVNAFTGLESGVRRFDSSVGGIGGSPFADGAAGNVATESLVHLLHDCGYDTGISFETIVQITKQLAGMLGHALPSPLSISH